MTEEVMIDIETLDVKPRSVVLSVAAMKFTQEEGAHLKNIFYKRFDLQSQFDRGRTVSEDTLRFWMDQPAAVRNEAFGIQTLPCHIVLQELSKFCEGATNYWANGPMFDMIILEDLARQCGIFEQLSWKFYMTRDVRTLADEAGMDRRWQPNDFPDEVALGAHHPVADCYAQIEKVRTARDMLPVMGL